MHRLRTIRALVPWLVGLFVVAQLAGVVPVREASASHSLIQLGGHVHDHGKAAGQSGHHHHDHGMHDHGMVDLDGACCALHALLIGIIPQELGTAPVNFARAALTMISEAPLAAIHPGRLDRPPRPSPLI
jgi:hypothetical protein